MPTSTRLTLSRTGRAELESLARSHRGRADEARRARIILLLSDGSSYATICERIDCTPQTIANTTVTGGLFDGDDVTYPAVSGNSVEAIIIYIDTGNTATSRLVAYIDTGVTGLPVTPNGGDISISWNPSGIFQL